MIVLLNPVFSCSKGLLSSSADKVITGTYNLQSVILKTAFVGLLISAAAGSSSGSASLVALLVIKQFSNQVKIRLISLTNRKFNDFQELLRCFSGTTISTSSFPTLLPSNFPVILVL